MDKKTTIIAIVGILIIFIGTLIFNLVSNRNEISEPELDLIEIESNIPVQAINVNHQFINGEHTLVGNLVLPTPCHSYNAVAEKDNSGTKIVITTEEGEGMCAQVLTDVTFRISFEGEENEIITGTLNEKPIIFNFFEIPEGESIDDYEMMIKG